MMEDRSGRIPYLPERIQDLERLAFNLWWRWDRRARWMLRAIDPVLWSATRHNPVAMLKRVSPHRLAHCASDPDFLSLYDRTMADFWEMRESAETWFSHRYPDVNHGNPVAYFCAEFGLHNSIPIYSGGLGVLAGDHCKAASDLGVPLIGVGLLYSKGYFDQKLNLEGWQEDSDEAFDPNVMPLTRLTGPGGTLAMASVSTAGRQVHVGAWLLEAGRVKLYLLDTNLPENHEEDRELTYKLYSGGQEHRLKQEWILGVGGVRVLRTLGLHPGAWHANEGHASFMLVERLRERMLSGLSLDEANRAVRAESIFTTHTPVPAGHDMFPPESIDKVCSDFWAAGPLDRDTFFRLGAHPDLDRGRFHMTAAAIRLSARVNGVSKRHARVTQELWTSLWPGRAASHLSIQGITNGVHLPSWMSHHLMELLEEVFGPEWEADKDNPPDWNRVLELDDRKVWKVHLLTKNILLDFCREQARVRWIELWREAAHLVGAGTLLTPEPLTLGFARRFATYKRANLLFRDEERLRRLLTDPRRPVQLVFSGKAHPADDDAKRVLQRVWQLSRDARFEGRVAFVEDYELHVAHRLVQGVDVWLNMPRVPMEASGTSGMKAGLNCVPQISTLDGWWAEGFNGANGWAIPVVEGSDDHVDAHDHDALFTLLEREIVPLYYHRDEHGLPRDWIKVMKETLRVAGTHFTTERMVKEYTERFYVPALASTVERDDPPTV
ncbi:MAG: alpha-glucan family phosphorylase [Longimicrobiales bacterium]|nr:alpha-glucan family phosphorylase [Longimicrobiales bacterium]